MLFGLFYGVARSVPRIYPAKLSQRTCEVPASPKPLNEVTDNPPAHDRRDAAMANEFLTASMDAAKDLQSAQARHAQLVHKADQRLEAARSRRDLDVMSARRVEAESWKRLMAIPGMTTVTAARIGNTSATKVDLGFTPFVGPLRSWLSGCGMGVGDGKR